MTTTQSSATTSLFLLLITDEGKPESFGQQTALGLAGAMLTDLLVAGRVGLTPDGKKVQVLDTTPLGDPLLDEGLRRYAQLDGKQAASAVRTASKKLDQVVGRYLADHGVVRVVEGGMLGFRPETYPVVDSSVERAVRDRIDGVLRGADPSVQDRSVLGILHGLRVDLKILRQDDTGLDKRDLKARLKQVAEGADPGAQAVDKALQQAIAAISSASAVGAVAAASS